MCTELFLALLYFFTLSFTNFFLFFLIKKNIEKINIFRIYKKIQKYFPSINYVAFLYIYNKLREKNKNFEFSSSLEILLSPYLKNKKKNLKLERKDLLFLSSFYFNLKEIETAKNVSKIFYYTLLMNQYKKE